MTEAYVRINRDGKWQSIEIEKLTDQELEEFEKSQPDDGWKWARYLARWIRDNVKEP